MQIAFKTKSEIPLDAFTTFGINAKIHDNPLGRFGTGLKYAVAVILRTGGEISVWIKGVEHIFYLKKMEFRGKEFDVIRMKKARSRTGWFYTKLPFTTELGKDWAPWMAFRELASNTLDEGGEWFSIEDDYVIEDVGTTIIVNWPVWDAVLADTIPTFIDKDKLGEPLFSDPFVDIYDWPSRVLYYRGVRAYDTRNACRFTYNFKTDVDLTEDRTIKNIWWTEYQLCYTIRNKIEDEKLLKRILEKSEKDSFETHDLSLHDAVAGNQFSRTVRALHSSGHLGRSGTMYHTAYLSPPPAPATVSVRLTRNEWEDVVRALREYDEDFLAEKIDEQL